MSSHDHVLHLRVEQQGKVAHRYLNGNAPFYIGRSAQNDLPLFGETFPDRHPLFRKKGRHYEMHLPVFAEGEIKGKRSRLRFADLIEHDLLPRGKDFHTFHIKPGHMGYIFLDSTRIDFIIEDKQSVAAKQGEVIDFDGFDPWRVFLKSLRDDGVFKGLVSLLLIVNIGTLYGLRGYIPPPKQRSTMESTIERLTRLVIAQPQTPEPEPEIERATIARASNGDSPPKEKKPEKAPEKPPEPAAPTKKRINPSQMGVLAVLSGSGESASNSVIQQLLDNDLAASVDDNINSGRLQVGSRDEGGTNTDEILDLLAGGGIDDLIGDDIGSVDAVQLSEKGTVQIESLGEVSGSEEAIGARSEGSLRSVLERNMGRLQFIYNKYLRQDPNFRGLMRVEVTIAANGRVTQVELISTNLNNSAFENEIVDRLRQFRFDPIERGSLRVVYPLSFFRQ